MRKVIRDTMPIDRIKEIVNYDPLTGIFTWKAKTRHNMPAVGKGAGGVKSNGRSKHRYIRIDKVDYLAQRVAWVILYGKSPDGRIMFKDGNSLNLKADNLFLQGFFAQGFDTSTPEGRSAYQRAYRSATPSLQKERALKDSFGITLREYEKMLIAQNGKCAICLQEETLKRRGNEVALSVDHDHQTGKIRSLLCASCNQGLGQFKENVTVLRAAADYLEKHKEQKVVTSNVVSFRSV